jgi:hypothetical protein
MTAFESSGPERSTPGDDVLGDVTDVAGGISVTAADVVPGDAVKTLRGDTMGTAQAGGEMLGTAVISTDEATASCASRLLLVVSISVPIAVSAVAAGMTGEEVERFDREWFMAATAAVSSNIAL